MKGKLTINAQKLDAIAENTHWESLRQKVIPVIKRQRQTQALLEDSNKKRREEHKAELADHGALQPGPRTSEKVFSYQLRRGVKGEDRTSLGSVVSRLRKREQKALFKQKRLNTDFSLL